MLILFFVTAPAGAGGDPVAERWRRFLLSPEAPPKDAGFPYLHCFRQAAAESGLPLSLLLAVARGESNFDHQARSSADALGLMQIRWPGTARHLGITRREALFEPCTNVTAGARYLKELLTRYQGDLHRALAAYNYGPGRIAVDPGRPLPAGARWYSGYIQDHLERILGGGQAAGRLLLVRFSRPYRARALVASLRPRLGGVPLDWFRRPDGQFQVVVAWRSDEERRRARALLMQLGFEI